MSRIDGVANPDEGPDDCARFVHEIHWYRRGLRMREETRFICGSAGYAIERLPPRIERSSSPVLPRALIGADARCEGTDEIAGRLAVEWSVVLHAQRTKIWLCARQAVPLRMRVEKLPDHWAQRDFLQATVGPIDPAIFAFSAALGGAEPKARGRTHEEPRSGGD